MHVVSPADANALVLQRMTDYIYSHFDEPISLDDIAHAGGVSRSQCTKLFKRYTSSSPISFVNTYRLEQSRVLLRSYSISVWEVALSSGFKDQSYLNRGFSREYGSTPLSYRRGIV
jgi:AraC-like DNA-binding protein